MLCVCFDALIPGFCFLVWRTLSLPDALNCRCFCCFISFLLGFPATDEVLLKVFTITIVAWVNMISLSGDLYIDQRSFLDHSGVSLEIHHSLFYYECIAQMWLFCFHKKGWILFCACWIIACIYCLYDLLKSNPLGVILQHVQINLWCLKHFGIMRLAKDDKELTGIQMK